MEIQGELRPLFGKHHVNEFISKELAPALRKIATAGGYRITGAEAMGGFKDPDIRGRIDYITLAIILVTVAKNAATSEGACPVTALLNMLRSDIFRVTANDDFVRHCIDMLRRARLIGHDNKWWPGRCPRYKVAAVVVRHLPFLADVKLPMMDEARVEQASRYTAGEGQSRPLTLLFSSQTVHRPVADHLARHQDQDEAEDACITAAIWLDAEENLRS